MTNLATESIGMSAGILTTIAFVPQVLQSWRTGGRGLSWGMLALFGSGVGLWLVYGLLNHTLPIILANALTGLQVLVLAGIKVRRGIRSGE